MKTIKNLTADQIRKSILQLAIQGKLVKQDPNDEPASELVKRIYEEKQRLIKEGKLKKDKNESYIYKGDDNCYYEKVGKNKVIKLENLPFEIPDNWSWIRLSSFCDIYTGDSINESDKNKLYRNCPEGYDYIGTKDVNFNHTIVYENGVKIPYDTQFKICPKSKILLCIEGGSAGRKIAFTSKDVCFGNKLACFNSCIVNDRYLYLFLQSPLFLQLFKDKLTGIISGVSINNLKQLFLPLPPLKEQERIVEKFKFCEPLLSRYELIEQNITLLETSLEEKLKASILQYAIEGKLVKQNPNDEPASVLLERIKAEKEKLISEGKIKRDKNDPIIKQSDDKNYYGDLPKTWLIIKIGQVLDVYRGGSPRPIESFLTTKQGGINWVKIGDTIQGDKYIVSCKQKIIKDGLSKTRLIQPGDLLLTNSMSFGRPYISKIYGAVHDGWLVFSDFSNSFDKDYLFYLLSSVSILEQFKSTVSGAVVKNLNIDKVKNTNIPLLSKNEQTRIAKRIESIFLTL